MGYHITLFIGVLVFLKSLYELKLSLDFVKNGKRAIATVVELETIADSEGVSYKPIFLFVTPRQQEVLYKYHTASNPADWYVGEHTTIVYDENDPTEAKLLTYYGMFGKPVILLAIALPLLVIGGGFSLYEWLMKGFILNM